MYDLNSCFSSIINLYISRTSEKSQNLERPESQEQRLAHGGGMGARLSERFEHVRMWRDEAQGRQGSLSRY